MDRTLTTDQAAAQLLQQVTVADIAARKVQQWSTTNLVVVIDVTILAIAQQFLSGPLHIGHGSLLVGLAWTSCSLGIATVFSLQRMIQGRRIRLETGDEKLFGEHGSEALSILKPRENLCWFFSLVMMLSAGIATWLVLAKSI